MRIHGRSRLALPAAGSLLFLSALPLWGYKPPAGPRSNPNNQFVANLEEPHAHGTIALKAIDVLRGDGQAEMADFFHQFRQELLNGVRQADEAGAWVVLGKNIPRNTFSHFYNPATRKGFVLHLDELGIIRALLTPVFSVAAWQLNTLKGPHPASPDMCDWAYAEAVQAMRQNNTRRAIEKLGWAIHYVADGTVPQHATDEGLQKPGSHHAQYEAACDDMLPRIPHAVSGGVYMDHKRPGEFVEHACGLSAPLLPLAKNSRTYEQAARSMIPLAERLTAGLLARFFRRWKSEQFTVVVARIDSVEALPGYRILFGKKIADLTRNIDSPDEADFYANVMIDGREYATGIIDGENEIRPNSFVPFCWVFPRWTTRTGTVQVRVRLHDDDTLTSDDHIDITPTSATRDLVLTYNLGNGVISGHRSAAETSGRTLVTAQGDDMGDIARVSLRFDRLPTVSPRP